MTAAVRYTLTDHPGMIFTMIDSERRGLHYARETLAAIYGERLATVEAV